MRQHKSYTLKSQTTDPLPIDLCPEVTLISKSRIKDTVYSTLHSERQRRTDDIYFYLINKCSVPEFIKVCGRNSESVKQFLKWLCENTEERLTDAKKVWVGYEPKKNPMPVLIAEVKGQPQTVGNLFNKFQILQRSEGHVSDEARYVAEKELNKGLEFTAVEQVEIHKCLSKHTDNLMRKHSNLLIVSASKIKSQNYGNKVARYDIKTCIVFYVHIKGVIPFNEDTFPTELDGFPIDVREGTFKTYSNPSDFHEHLMMGCQIVTAYKMACTLGGFVELESGNIGCLTCGHVFETEESVADFNKDRLNQSFLKKEVYQPEPEPYFEFGKLSSIIRNPGDSENIGVDAAIIEITNLHRYPCNGEFPGAVSPTAGFTPTKPMVFNTGKVITSLKEVPIPCNVVKYGASTGHTIGLLRLFGSAVHKHSTSFQPNDMVRLHQQFEVWPIMDQIFANEGDSGSLVFLLTNSGGDMEIRALGLIVGGTDHKTTLVTPIWAVLNSLKLPLKLLSFEAENKEPSVKAKNQRLDKIETDLSDVKSQLEETTKRTGAVEEKIDRLDCKIDGTKSGVDQILNIVSSLSKHN